MKLVQPTIKTGMKWKVVEAVVEAKECLKIKEKIGQNQTELKGVGLSTPKWWSIAEKKEKRDMVINEILLNEDSRRVQKAVQQPQQVQWTKWDNALQKSLTWNEILDMASHRISFLIRSVYDLLPSNATLVGKERGSHLPAIFPEDSVLSSSPMSFYLLIVSETERKREREGERERERKREREREREREEK